MPLPRVPPIFLSARGRRRLGPGPEGHRHGRLWPESLPRTSLVGVLQVRGQYLPKYARISVSGAFTGLPPRSRNCRVRSCASASRTTPKAPPYGRVVGAVPHGGDQRARVGTLRCLAAGVREEGVHRRLDRVLPRGVRPAQAEVGHPGVLPGGPLQAGDDAGVAALAAVVQHLGVEARQGRDAPVPAAGPCAQARRCRRDMRAVAGHVVGAAGAAGAREVFGRRQRRGEVRVRGVDTGVQEGDLDTLAVVSSCPGGRGADLRDAAAHHPGRCSIFVRRRLEPAVQPDPPDPLLLREGLPHVVGPGLGTVIAAPATLSWTVSSCGKGNWPRRRANSSRAWANWKPTAKPCRSRPRPSAPRPPTSTSCNHRPRFCRTARLTSRSGAYSTTNNGRCAPATCASRWSCP
jgi:hypothetical protein